MNLACLNPVYYILVLLTVSAQVFSSEIIIPEIKNKQGITVVVEKGHWTQYVKQNLVPHFTLLTQVSVNIVEVELSNMYQLQENSLINAKGDFDVLTLEAGWAKEWAAKGYTVPLSELAKQFEHDQLG